MSDLRERIDSRPARGAAVIVLAGAIGLVAGAVPSHAMGARDEGSTAADRAIRASAVGAPAPAPAAGNAAGGAGSSAAPSGVRGLFGRLLGRDPGTGDCALVGVRADEAGASQLFWFDVATGRTMSLTADLPNADVRAVEVSPVSGAVYVVTGGRGRYPGRLYVLDEASGRLSVVGELSGARADAVGDAAFRPDGSLWAFRRNVGLVTIDLATGWSRVLWPVTGDGIGLAWDGVAWDPAGEYLYGAQGGDLYRWDPRTRSASVLCRSGLLPADVAGLDFRSDGTLVAGRRNAAMGNLTFVAVDLESCSLAAAEHDVAAPGVTSFSYAACGKPASLSATVWRDENANGAIDLGEPPLAGVKVALRSGACGAPGEVVARARTATDGGYTFDDVAPGPYCVEVESDSGKLAPVVTTGAAGHTVVVPAGQGAEASSDGEAPGFGLLDDVAYKRIAAVAPGAAEESSAMPGAGAAALPNGASVGGRGAGLDDFSGTGPATADSVGPDSTDPIAGDGGCSLYPIALSSEMMKDAKKGSRLGDIWNGTQPGNFGWLSWTGKLSTGVLATSLTPPGDSYKYINPQNPDDHTVSVGDWVKGRPGVSNRSRIRNALNTLKTMDIVVPVWDQATGRGSKARYRVSGYASVRITSYRLPGNNRITARYVGEAECDVEHEEEEPEVEFCPYDLDVPVGATFNIRNYVHRKHEKDDDEDKPIDWSRVTFTYRDDDGGASPIDWHLDDFNAGLDVNTVADDMAPGTGNHGDGEYRIYMVRDGALLSDDHMTIRVNDDGADDVEEARCDYVEPEEEVPEVEFCPRELGIPVGATFDLRDYVSYRHKDDDDDGVDWSRVAFTYIGGGANDPVPGNWHLDDFNAGRKVTVTAADMAPGTGNDGDGRYRVYVVRDGKTRYDDFVTLRVNDDGHDDVESGRCESERDREKEQKEVDFCPLELNLEVGDTFNIRDYIREKVDDSDEHKDGHDEHEIDWRQVHFTYTDGQAADPPQPGDWHLDDFNAGRDVTVTAGDMAPGTGNDGDGRYRLYVVRDSQIHFDDYITIRVDDDGDSEVDSVKCDAEKEKKAESEVEFCPVVFNVTVGDTFNIREYVHHKDSDEGKDDDVDWEHVRFTYVEAGADDPPDDGNWHLTDFNTGSNVTVTADDMKPGTGNHGDGEYRLYVVREGREHYDDFVTINVNDDGASDVETAKCGQEEEKVTPTVPEVEFCPFEMKVAVGDAFNIRDYLHEKDDNDEEHDIDWSRVKFTYTEGDADDKPNNGNWHLDDFNAGRAVTIKRKDMEHTTGNHGEGVYRLYVKRDDEEHYDDFVTIRVNDDDESDVETARCDADNKGDRPEAEVEFCPLVLDVPVGGTFEIRDYVHHKDGKDGKVDDDKVEWSKVKFTYVDGEAKDPPTPGGWHLDDFNAGREVTVSSADMAPGTGNHGAGQYRLYIVRQGKSHYDDYVTIRVNGSGESNVDTARCDGPTLYPAPTAVPSVEPSPEPSVEPSPQPSPEPLTSGVVQGSVYLKLCPPPESTKNELSTTRGPVDVVHVLDVSGSMGWGWGGRSDRSRPRKLTSAKQALIAFDNFLDPTLGDQAGLASFGYGQTVKGYVGAYARTDMRLTDKIDAVNSRISALYPKAWTPLALGIREGTGVLFGQRRNDSNVPVLIVTSDGNANTRLDGIHYGTTALERQGIYDARSSAEAIQMSLAARARGAEVYAIAVGDDLDEQVMRAIASPDINGITHFYRATTGDDLAAVYDAIMSTATHLKRTRDAGQCDLDYVVPAASAKVRLLNEATSAVYATNSSASGRFTLTGVPVGTYRLLAQDGTFDQMTVEPCVQGNDTVRVLVADGATTYQDVYLGEAVAKECPASYALQKTLTSPNPAQVGETVTFEIRVVNTDPKRTITTLPLMDSFDNEYLKFLSATPMPDQLSQVTGMAMWTDITTALGDIPPGGEVVVTVSFRAAKGTGMTVAVNRARTENGVDSGGYHLPTLEASDTVKIGAAGVFAYILLDPTITSVCNTGKLGFTATAYDANYGTTNGAGIERVLFQVYNEHGALVYEKTERQVNYCGFGGNGKCPDLDLSKGMWTSVDGLHTVGGPIEFGQRHTLKVTAFGLSGDAASVSRILDIVLCDTEATATPTATATFKPTPTWTPSPSPTPTFTPTPTPTLTPTVTPSPTGHPIGSVLDNFGCSQVAAFCNLGNWVDASAAQTLADAANANLVPSMDVAWHAITPRRTGEPFLETGVNVPTWFWLDGGYVDTVVDNGNTQLSWQSLGPVAWCLGAGNQPMFSMNNGYAFDIPLSAVDTINPAASVKSLPLPKFEYSSLGQPHRLDDGPYAGVSSFQATVVSTWWVAGQVDTGSGIVSVNTEVPYCDRVNVWVRQPQSILVEPQKVPDWVNTP